MKMTNYVLMIEIFDWFLLLFQIIEKELIRNITLAFASVLIITLILITNVRTSLMVGSSVILTMVSNLLGLVTHSHWLPSFTWQNCHTNPVSLDWCIQLDFLDHEFLISNSMVLCRCSLFSLLKTTLDLFFLCLGNLMPGFKFNTKSWMKWFNFSFFYFNC